VKDILYKNCGQHERMKKEWCK